MLVVTRPPIIRDSFNLSDPVMFAERQFVILCRVVAIASKTKIRSQLQRNTILRTRIMPLRRSPWAQAQVRAPARRRWLARWALEAVAAAVEEVEVAEVLLPRPRVRVRVRVPRAIRRARRKPRGTNHSGCRLHYCQTTNHYPLV